MYQSENKLPRKSRTISFTISFRVRARNKSQVFFNYNRVSVEAVVIKNRSFRLPRRITGCCILTCCERVLLTCIDTFIEIPTRVVSKVHLKKAERPRDLIIANIGIKSADEI